LVQRGQFRLDLFHRLAGWVFRVPPLRERREDILPLASHFLSSDAPPEFDDAVCEYLVNRYYPGNIRELRHGGGGCRGNPPPELARATGILLTKSAECCSRRRDIRTGERGLRHSRRPRPTS
jgi:hypothetical protein